MQLPWGGLKCSSHGGTGTEIGENTSFSISLRHQMYAQMLLHVLQTQYTAGIVFSVVVFALLWYHTVLWSDTTLWCLRCCGTTLLCLQCCDTTLWCLQCCGATQCCGDGGVANSCFSNQMATLTRPMPFRTADGDDNGNDDDTKQLLW